ncbi:branched-chain amino acid ABC transporter permease [Amaricoccus solimangrovi]|uniref:Branched-chain amino acid ABC transporter permease n=1 Tax=Amaricoccus solimangrovi TaxID=2589815 RepID=A0A501WDR9_9RHOB|nr:branched-chain amino acid ABC transporter permease [Amaricoccus solimangrovi]TPE48033.1 branched-chain amino acid ABC transporter permease [Amaricoccus solimangrovi]
MTGLEYFFAQILNGLSAGSIYALIAVGYSMVFGVLQMHNFAHGDTLMFGTYVAMALMLVGVPAIAAIPLGILLGGAMGFFIERIAFRPTRTAHRMVPTVSAIAVALIIRNTAQLIWGTTTEPFPLDIPVARAEVFGIGVTSTQVAVFGVALALMLATDLFVRKTMIGKAMRAVQQDIDAAGYMGIPVNRTIAMVYVLGGLLGVAGGILFAINYNTVYLMMGFTVMMKAFVAAVIGGIGNIKGAFVGGLVLGVAEALAAAYFDTGYRDGIAMGLLILVLLVRPQGLFGRPIQVKV